MEFIVLFGGVPAGLLLLPGRLVIPTILAVGVVVAVWLVKDRTFDRRQLANWAGVKADWRRIVGLVVLAGVLGGAAVLVFIPERWLWLPRNLPMVWVVIMVGYPVFSVYAQELIFRTFLFQRYGASLAACGRSVGLGGTLSVVAASGAAFGWAHVILENWVAISLSTLGGVMLAWTYARTRSTLAVSLEHAGYGCVLFTVGLGQYFYYRPQ